MTNAQHPARRLLEAFQADRSHDDNMVDALCEPGQEPELDDVVIDGRFDLAQIVANVYPFESGDSTVIGPECFTNPERDRIMWRGELYVKSPSVDGLKATVSTGGTARLEESAHGPLVLLDHPDAPKDMRHYEVGRIVEHGSRRGFQSAPFSVGAISPETLRAIAALIEASE